MVVHGHLAACLRRGKCRILYTASVEHPDISAAEAAVLLDKIAPRATDAHQISRLIAEELGDEPPEKAKWLRAAFDYMLRFRDEEGSSAFVPMLGFKDGSSYPPVPGEVSKEMSAFWEEVAASVTHPLPKARLTHLLVETAPKRAHIHARSAAVAYIQAFPLHESELDKLQALHAAQVLSIRFNIKDVASELSVPLRELVASVLAGEKQMPGVSIPALEILDEMGDEQVDALLAIAHEKYGGDAYNLEGVLAIQRKRASTDKERKALDAERVRAWLREAEKADSLARLMHLETAARLAEELGLKDLKEEAVALLQAISPDDIPLQHIRSEVEIPAEAVEQYLQQFVEGYATWWESFQALVFYEPPTGTLEQNEASIKESAREAPLHDLLPKVKLGGDKLPRFKALNDEDRKDEKLAEQEGFRLQVMTPLRAGALERICSHHGKPSREELEGYFAELPGIRDDRDARVAADCFMRYWDGDGAGAYVCVALVERLIRNLALKTGRSLYRVQREKRPGQYPGLGFLLRELRKSLDPSWYRFLWTFLASPAGVNFRNELFHGFVREPSGGHLLLLLSAMTYVASLDTSAEVEADSNP